MPPEPRAARRRLRAAAFVAVATLASTGATELTAQDTSADVVLRAPTPADVTAWRDHILPDQAELRWESIPWLPTFGAGLCAASARGRPLLLYAMNGHPLGCT